MTRSTPTRTSCLAVHITYAAAPVAAGLDGHRDRREASLSGGLRHIGDDVADIMAAFSSRGANVAVSMISPSRLRLRRRRPRG